MNEKNKTQYPLNVNDMLKLNKDAKLITYDYLNKVFNIDDMFKDTDKLIILYLLKNEYSGHWCCLFKNKKTGLYEFFDSYGKPEDTVLDNLSILQRIKFNEEQDRLRLLLRNKIVIYNNVVFQGKNTKTCGCHCTFRLHNYDKTLDEYIKIFTKNNIKNPDNFVASYCLKLLK